MQDHYLTAGQFDDIRRALHAFCGLSISDEKRNLVQSRLTKRLRSLGIDRFEQYFDLVGRDQSEFSNMIDVLTTNKTSFFREEAHFKFLRDRIVPSLPRKRVRVWSSACSSGEEPYSIGICLRESVRDSDGWDMRVLATDISSSILAKAKGGEYPHERLSGVSIQLRDAYFQRSEGDKYVVSDEIRRMVKFARLNLLEDWKMSGPFDVIFCRNVMIYFDTKTRQTLVNRFYDMLPEGGHLFIGHAESLSGIDHKFQYVQPAVFVK